MPIGTPTLEEIFRLMADRDSANLYVAGPGRVESYDATRQVADIQPMVKRMTPTIDPDLPDVAEADPVIPSVPVLHPRGNGWSLHIPLVEGDTVLLVYLDQDFAQWRRTGELATPGDRRLHHPAYAVAIPGLFPSTSTIPGAHDTNVTLRRGGFEVTFTPDRMEVGGNSDAAALASRVADLETALIGHKHQLAGGVVGTSLELAPPAYLPQDFASSKLKLGG